MVVEDSVIVVIWVFKRGIETAIAIVIGSRLIDSGDFATPFLIMAAFYLTSTLIYWRFFRPIELDSQGEDATPETDTAPVVASPA